MARLRERNRQIPGGLRYKCSPLKYQSSNWHSFDKIVADVWARIRSNPHLAAKHNLPNTRSGVEDMVDAYNAMVCEQNGWLDFITSGGEEAAPVPKWFSPQMSSRLGGKLVAGALSLLKWLGEGGEPVPRELAGARAAVCVKCPQNRRMELKDFFVHGASELLRRQIEFAKDCGLDTAQSKELGICDICACPLKLKVFVPIEPILKHIQPDVREALPPHCWMKVEALELYKRKDINVQNAPSRVQLLHPEKSKPPANNDKPHVSEGQKQRSEVSIQPENEGANQAKAEDNNVETQ